MYNIICPKCGQVTKILSGGRGGCQSSVQWGSLTLLMRPFAEDRRFWSWWIAASCQREASRGLCVLVGNQSYPHAFSVLETYRPWREGRFYLITAPSLQSKWLAAECQTVMQEVGMDSMMTMQKYTIFVCRRSNLKQKGWWCFPGCERTSWCQGGVSREDEVQILLPTRDFIIQRQPGCIHKRVVKSKYKSVLQSFDSCRANVSFSKNQLAAVKHAAFVVNEMKHPEIFVQDSLYLNVSKSNTFFCTRKYRRKHCINRLCLVGCGE